MHIGFLAGFHAIHVSLERSCFSKIGKIIFLALVALKLLVSLTSCLVACSARIVVDKQTNRQTDRQNDYCNPRCACAPRVNRGHSVDHIKMLRLSLSTSRLYVHAPGFQIQYHTLSVHALDPSPPPFLLIPGETLVHVYMAVCNTVLWVWSKSGRSACCTVSATSLGLPPQMFYITLVCKILTLTMGPETCTFDLEMWASYKFFSWFLRFNIESADEA